MSSHSDNPVYPPVGRALFVALAAMILICLASFARIPSSQDVELAWRMNPDTATQSELQLLPGIGPALTARIIADRVNGPYRSPADLQRVSGIGPTISSRIAASLSFSASETPETTR